MVHTLKTRRTRTSDIDVVVVGEFPVNAFTRDIRNLESKLNREINFTSYTREEIGEEREKERGDSSTWSLKGRSMC